MYDLNKKIIFTHPPKCGGTSIEHILGFLTLRKTYPNIHRIKHGSLKLHLDTIKNKGELNSTFFKFSIIRNPWDRVVSFFNHCRYKEYDYYTKRAVNLELPEFVKSARCMSFSEFVFNYGETIFNSDIATKPFMCVEDKICVDFVIKLETLAEDLSVIAHKLQVNEPITIPHLNNSNIYVKKVKYQNYY